MNTGIQSLEQELKEAEARFRNLAKMLETAQESQGVVQGLLGAIDSALEPLDTEGKSFVVAQIISHLEPYTANQQPPKATFTLDGVTILNERFGARRGEEGYDYFCGIDYRRVKGDNQNSTSVWRNFIQEHYPCDSVEIVDNAQGSPIKGKYLVVASGATLRDVALLGNMNLEKPPRTEMPDPLNIDENLNFFAALTPPETPTETELDDAAAYEPHQLIGRTITTNAYGSQMVGKITAYIDGEDKPWRVAVPDVPVELFLNTEDFELYIEVTG